MKSNEINIRDPYILPYDGKYYLYGTRSETAFVGQAYGFDVYGMIFKSFSDQYYLVLHYPNKFGKEHPSFMPLKYEDGKFQLDKNAI